MAGNVTEGPKGRAGSHVAEIQQSAACLLHRPPPESLWHSWNNCSAELNLWIIMRTYHCQLALVV